MTCHINIAEKGMTVTPTEHNAEFASTPATGLCAMLRGLFRVNGIGASSRRPARMVVAAVSIALLCLACSSAPASAVFTRPFLKQLQGQSGGVAVDQEDDLWVLGSPTELSEFSPFPAVEPKGTLAVAGSGFHRELAIEQSSGHFYEVVGEESRVDVFEGSGARFGGWKNEDVFDGGPSGGPETGVQVAVDNNPVSDVGDPSACGVSGCVVYVEHAGHDLKAPVGDGLPAGIEKFNAGGEAVAFSKGGGWLVVCERQRDHGHAVRIVREHRNPACCGGGRGGRHLRVCRWAGGG